MESAVRDSLIKFQGAYQMAGYELRGHRLVVKKTSAKNEEELFLEPYDPPADLFIQFAALPKTPEAVLEFASLFGHLRMQTFGLWQGPYVLDVRAYFAEQMSEWFEAIDEMNRAVQLMSRVKGACVAEGRTAAREPFKLAELVNDHLKNVPLQVNVSNTRPITFRQHLVPANLLEFMWAQLAETLATGRTICVCRGCRKLMTVWPEGDGKRVSARTCSGNCRVRAHNNDKKMACQLYADGVPLREILPKLVDGGWRPSSADPLTQLKKWVSGIPVTKTGRVVLPKRGE